MTLAGSLPTLQPFSVGVVYRVRDRGDFDGILTAAPPAGADHTDFWTFRSGTAGSLEMQLFGRSAETDDLSLSRTDSGAAQINVWTMGSGTASLRDGTGSSTDTYGDSFGAPAGIVLAGRERALRLCRDRRAGDDRRHAGAVDDRSGAAGRLGQCEMEPVGG